MLKKYRVVLVITAIIILLPILAGVFLWDSLPESMATHFDSDGNANGYSPKAFAVFGLPLIVLALHLLCFFVTMLDPKKRNIPGKALGVVLWICPAVSVVCSFATYAYALNIQIPFITIIIALMGVLFMVIGNYMPKCKQNYTMGIKLPWTLADEQVWNKTHRLAGFVWTLGGAIIVVTSFLKSLILFMTLTVVLVLVPTVYSIVIYNKSRH